MAEADSNPQLPKPRLKYLEFVLVAVLHALIFVAKLYSFAKENSGPLKPGINAVENTVRSFLGPVYGKFQYVPFELLLFVDRKIDECVNKVRNRIPPTLKRTSSKAYKNAKKAPVAARSVMSDIKNTSMVETASGLVKTVYANYQPVAKDFYSKYEPVTEQYAVNAWHSLNQYALFHRAVQTVVPIASYCSEKYNQKVQDAAGKGYKVASHLPLVPTEKIAEMLRTENVEPVVEVAAHGEAVASQ